MEIFSDQVKEKITHYLSRYETKRSAILPILHTIQDTYGWIQKEHIDALELSYGLSKVDVREVATFYSMYRLNPSKPLRIYFCDNVVCRMMGSDRLSKKIQSHLEEHYKDKDCPFSLEAVPCLGVCDGAPAMLVNKNRYLKVDESSVSEILSQEAKKSL